MTTMKFTPDFQRWTAAHLVFLELPGERFLMRKNRYDDMPEMPLTREEKDALVAEYRALGRTVRVYEFRPPVN